MVEIGCVIGRFQVENLHEGHRYLINEAFRHHSRVIIFVGCAPIQGTKHDPLDFPTRKRMLSAAYPDAIILPQYDHLSDEIWSKNLDAQIRGIVPNVSKAKLYGGRKSFQPHYCGEFEVVEIDSGIEYRSGTKQREDIGKVERSSSDFRAGIIYSTQNSWPYVKMCVDIAYVRKCKWCSGTGREWDNGDKIECRCEHEKYRGPNKVEILLGRKESENKWRLPGGMVEKGQNLEEAACRELSEETGMSAEIKNLKYIGSFPVGDWRFKNAGEIGILTALFVTEHQWGAPRAGDDLCEVKWFPLDKAQRHVVKGHKTLVGMVQKEMK